MPRLEDNVEELIALERGCRSALGDRLRSVTIDSPEWNGTVYRREDLDSGVDEAVHDAIHEVTADCEATLADGGHTVREFDEGYVARLQHGDTRVVVTSDGLKMDRESELSAVVRGVLTD